MKSTRNSNLVARCSVIAVRGTLAALTTMPMAIYAAEMSDEVRDLVQPSSSLQVGVMGINRDSYKFGEYNGLEEKGATPNLSFDLRGGAYGPDATSAMRYRIKGTDLGLETRNLSAEFGSQGTFRLKFGYDELRHNIYDSYKSLWNGAGSTTQTLPAGYPAPGARTTSTGLANWNNIQAPNLNAVTTGGGPGYLIPALMRDVDISNKRKKSDLGFGYIFNNQWSFSSSIRHEDKDGTKLTGVAMGGFKGALLPEPISYSTDIFDASVRYVTDKGRLSLAYTGSQFRNGVGGWTAQQPFVNNSTLNNTVMMSGAPDNEMHQLTLSGAYNFTKTTKLVATGSYVRMTQNDQFNYQLGNGWNVNNGATSANAKEIGTKFFTKLTSRLMDDLALTAAYRYDDRDNKTPVGNYLVTQYDSPAIASASASNNNVVNVPLNRRQQTFSLDLDYTLGRGQTISGGYEWQEIKRTADTAVDPNSHEIQNAWLSDKSKENTLRVDYSNSMLENLTARVGYAYSERRADNYEEPALNPLTASSNAGLYGELPGFKQFYLADRNRDKVRTSLSYQPTDQWSFQAGVDYNNDDFPSEFGVTQMRSWVTNIEATFAASDKLSFSAFTSYEDMKNVQNSLSMAVARGAAPVVVAHTACTPYNGSVPAGAIPADYYTDPCRAWSETQQDKIWTLGLGFKSNGMLGGKLGVNGDLSYTHAKTPITFSGGTYYSNGLSGGANSNLFVAAQDMPESVSKRIDLRLTGTYTVDKQQSVRVNYLYSRLRSNDAQYDAYNVTSVQAFIGPGITSPNYSVQGLGIAYVYTFH